MKFTKIFSLIIISIATVTANTNTTTASPHDTIQMTRDVMAIIFDAADKFCQTADLNYTKTNSELSARAKAKLSGVAAKLVDVGVDLSGSRGHKSRVGVLEEHIVNVMTATDQCKQDVFHTMWNDLKPLIRPSTNIVPTPSSIEACVVEDPTGTSLNVRTAPNGHITGHLKNDTYVNILQYETAANGKSWVKVSDTVGREIGWVFLPYIRCSSR